MKWSIQELLYARSIYKEYNILDKIIYFPKNFYKRTKLFFYWLFTGKTKEVLWSLDKYFTEIIAERLNDFAKNYKHGFPMEFINEDNDSDRSDKEWNETLRKMADAWDKMETEYYLEQMAIPEMFTKEIEVKGKKVNALDFVYKEGEEEKNKELVKLQRKNDEYAIEMFAKYYHNLWD
ncbi:MAG: hypothetical protein ACOCP4_02790 [Candidatus Woesearchaeota archaeon]